MSGLARRLVEAVQHSLLGALLVRLWLPLWMINFVVDQSNPRDDEVFLSSVISVTAVVMFLAWLLGVLAIDRTPKGRTALERCQDAPTNTFEVWTQCPVGGLRPPRLIRSLVIILGRTDSQKGVWEELLVCILPIALSFLILAVYSNGVLPDHANPFLANPSVRTNLIWCMVGLSVAACVRSWAIRYRKLLAPDVRAEKSR